METKHGRSAASEIRFGYFQIIFLKFELKTERNLKLSRLLKFRLEQTAES